MQNLKKKKTLKSDSKNFKVDFNSPWLTILSANSITQMIIHDPLQYSSYCIVTAANEHKCYVLWFYCIVTPKYL